MRDDSTKRKHNERGGHDGLARLHQIILAGELAGEIAHDINNPLTALLTHLELIGRTCEAPAVMARLSRIEREAERIARLNENILRLTRPTTGERQTVELGAVLAEVADVLAYELRVRRTSLELERETHCVVQANPSRLRQALISMVRYALGACPDAETLRTATRTQEDGVSVCVRAAPVAAERSVAAAKPHHATNEQAVAALLSVTDEELSAWALRRFGLWTAQGIARANGGSLEMSEAEEELALVLWLPTSSRR